MPINFVSVIVAVAVQFALGFVWYGPIFGKLWGQIHGFDKLSKETQQKMMKEMGPFYALQAFVTLITSIVLAIYITNEPSWNPYAQSAFFWIGFVVPTQISSVIFGGTDKKWILPKIAVQAGCSLVCLEAAAAIIYFMP